MAMYENDWTEVHYRRGRMAPRKRLNLHDTNSNHRSPSNYQSIPYRNRPNSNDGAYRKGSANRSEYRNRPYRKRPNLNDVAYHRGGANRSEYRPRPYQNRNRPVSNDDAYHYGSANQCDDRNRHYQQYDDTHRYNGETQVFYRSRPKYRTENRNRPTNRSHSDSTYKNTGQTSGQYTNPNRLTYAQVVKGNQSHKHTQQDAPVPSRVTENHSNKTSDQPPRMAAPPKLRAMVKPMVKLIKMVHHLHNVADENKRPPTFMALENYLSTIIKPAYPNDDTQLLLDGNAKNWIHTTHIILQQHYEQGIQDTLTNLIPLLEENWHVALGVAHRWAKRYLGPRLSSDTVAQVEALITAEFPVKTKHTLENALEDPDINLIDMETQTTPSITNREWSTEGNSSHLPPALSPQPNTQLQPQEKRLSRPRRYDNPCVQDVSVEIEACPLEQDDPDMDCQAIKDALDDTRPLIELLDSDLHSNPGLRTHEIRSDESRRTLNNEKENDTICIHTTPPKTPTYDTSPILTRVINTGQVTKQSVLSTPYNKVNRHIRTNRKRSDWSLTIRKKWVIIGDSNLSRIPPYQIPDLQVESFPGATFSHAESLIREASVTVKVEKIVLSFGVNHRDQKVQETAIKQLQGAVRMTKKKLTHSEIWIPEINLPDTLTIEQQHILIGLNRYITKHTGYIPALPSTEYKLVDNVHWTSDTAKAMLQHWAEHLNFIAI